MMDSFASWLISLFSWVIDAIYNVLVAVINAIVTVFCTFFDLVLNLLPTMSVSAPVSLDGESQFMGILNWFLPIGHIVNSITLYGTAMLLYFGVGPILRWIKVVK